MINAIKILPKKKSSKHKKKENFEYRWPTSDELGERIMETDNGISFWNDRGALWIKTNHFSSSYNYLLYCSDSKIPTVSNPSLSETK